jgi:Ca-activated chloride channel family protein
VSFARPEYLFLALLLPVTATLALLAWVRRRQAVARAVADASLLDRLGVGDLAAVPLPRILLICVASAALGVAAAGPRWGTRVVEGQSTSRSVVLALDVSKSMLAADVRPNRLERERLFVRRLLREMAGDRLGLVVFAGRAYVLSPLTVDHGALNLYIDALDPGIVSQGGSSLASAVMQATDLARGAQETAGDRAVILISDGEALEEEDAVMQASERAAAAGVVVHTVGIGTTSGSPVPELDQSGRESGEFKRDEDGRVVISRLNGNLLAEVSRRTGGRYVEVDQADATGRLLSAIGGMSRVQSDNGQRVEARERQGIFLAIALLLLLLDAWLERTAGDPRQRRLFAFMMPVGSRAAAVLLVLFFGTAAGIGDRERGNRLYRAGKYEEAVEAYQAALRSGDDSPELRYNLGTALLQLGRFPDAEQNFRAALDAVEPDLRERTFYNLGNRFLSAARSEPDVRRQASLLDGAIEAYRRSLRLDPADQQAKWNLELALRDKEENEKQSQGGEQPQQQPPSQDQQQGGGGGGGGGQERQNASEQPNRASGRTPLTREEADRVLSAVEQDERELTREKLRKGQRRTPVRRDW